MDDSKLENTIIMFLTPFPIHNTNIFPVIKIIRQMRILFVHKRCHKTKKKLAFTMSKLIIAPSALRIEIAKSHLRLHPCSCFLHRFLINISAIYEHILNHFQ